MTDKNIPSGQKPNPHSMSAVQDEVKAGDKAESVDSIHESEMITPRV
jgi:hypothetical protein